MDMKRSNKLFENVLYKYEKDLQKFIYTLTRKDQFAMEDIFQNTLEKAFKNLEYLRDESKIKSWIFSIAKTEARRYYAANRSYYDYETDELNEEISVIDDEVDFTEFVVDSYLVMQILNNFSEEAQRIFMLHYYYDIPLNEISKILHINYNTIRSIHSRGKSRMKKNNLSES